MSMSVKSGSGGGGGGGGGFCRRSPARSCDAEPAGACACAISSLMVSFLASAMRWIMAAAVARSPSNEEPSMPKSFSSRVFSDRSKWHLWRFVSRTVAVNGCRGRGGCNHLAPTSPSQNRYRRARCCDARWSFSVAALRLSLSTEPYHWTSARIRHADGSDPPAAASRRRS